MNAARPGITLTAVAAVAVGSAIAVTPAVAVTNPLPALATLDARDILLAGVITDQIAILTTYGQQALDDTAAWVSDLVTPLVNLQFWPLSGQPGNYLAGAFNSTVSFAQNIVSTGTGFVQAEIDWLTGLIPNIPNVINDVINTVVSAIQNVISWITGWIPWPFAAVAPSPAAAKVTATRTAAVKRPLSQPAAAAAATSSAPVSAAPVSANRKASRSAGKQAGRAAASRAAAKAAR